MDRLFWICLGGAAGSGARYLLSGWVLGVTGSTFPYGTLAVNLLGSFLLGALMQIGLTTEWMSPAVRLGLTTGVMGGFTTYSTFSYETTRLLQDGAWGSAALNVGGTVLGCLVASVLGLSAGKLLAGV
jgi:CrcB protein